MPAREPDPPAADAADTALEDAILAVFRAGGGRVTTARRAIVRALLDRPDHLTSDQIVAIVHESHPDVNQSSVYRTLGELERFGVLRHVHFGHGPAMYHLAQEDQLHLVCERCGRVVDVPTREVQAFLAPLRAEYGFVADLDHFAITGRCATHDA